MNIMKVLIFSAKRGVGTVGKRIKFKEEFRDGEESAHWTDMWHKKYHPARHYRIMDTI
jgi:hypothetical protein